MFSQFGASKIWAAIALLSIGIAIGALFGPNSASGQRDQRPKGIDEDLYFGVRLGVMVPYFGGGDNPPDGYVWADGKTKWPNADWVPIHLRGKPVPNMDGWLLGGTNNLGLVGIQFTNGKIEIQEKSVPGSAFTLPAPSNLRVSPNAGNHKEGGWVGGFIRNKDYPPAKGGPQVLAPGMAFGGYMEAVPAEYKGYNSAPALEGKSDLKWDPIALNDAKTLPRHYMARWIIRMK